MFNKPLVVLMGPWSGGKSTMINYLLGNEYSKDAFKTSAEPSTGFNFNIAMYGEHSEEMEGTEIAAEWAFSSLQKFGQEFLKKLKGKKMPNKLLEKVGLVCNQARIALLLRDSLGLAARRPWVLAGSLEWVDPLFSSSLLGIQADHVPSSAYLQKSQF